MRFLPKTRKAKAFRSNELFGFRESVRRDMALVDAVQELKIESLASDPAGFFKEVLDWNLTEYQKDLVELFSACSLRNLGDESG